MCIEGLQSVFCVDNEWMSLYRETEEMAARRLDSVRARGEGSWSWKGTVYGDGCSFFFHFGALWAAQG